MTDFIKDAKIVLGFELEGLRALHKAFDGSLGVPFGNAVRCLLDVSGRVIVTGIGKSGHVARKIAATFASTGAPSSFVHAGEASHGDLGMIRPGDAIVALSRSGETEELHDIIGYARRFAIPIIAMTARENSALARNADFPLVLPDAPEACGETHAPTTSTTMMMALGDALAVCLLRARGFTATDFQGFHPGGSLGAALRRVGDLMDGDGVPLCLSSASLTEAVAAIADGGYGCVGVVEPDGRLVGIITDGDLRRKFSQAAPDAPAFSVMTSPPRMVQRDTLAGDALGVMSRCKITALFVVEDGRPVGLLHIHHCLTVGVL